MYGGTWPPLEGELLSRRDKRQKHFPLDGAADLIDALPAGR
jgi:hypothetical protein